uniref:G-protein coupled receptors family 1 profile domain-containing protein n=1 Tax=Schistocephalus solidus TaxID=70667 RepID=A0A0X3NVJ0_SCHSO
MPHVAQTASHSNCLFESDSSDFSHAVGAFRAYASPIIAIAGLIGSLLIIIVFAKEKPRTRFSIFAISLAIAHSMSLILNTVMDDFLGRGLQFATGNQFTLKLDSTSTLACKLMEYFPNAMYFAASYLMVTFSLDRALTINRPLQFNSFFYRKYATLTCILVFVVGFLGNLPFLLIQKLQFNSAIPTNYTCVMNRDYPKMAKFAIVFSTLVTFFSPRPDNLCSKHRHSHPPLADTPVAEGSAQDQNSYRLRARPGNRPPSNEYRLPVALRATWLCRTGPATFHGSAR